MGVGFQLIIKAVMMIMMMVMMIMMMMVQNSDELRPTHPLHEVVDWINYQGGPYIGLVLAFPAEETPLIASGIFVPNSIYPVIQLSGTFFISFISNLICFLFIFSTKIIIIMLENIIANNADLEYPSIESIRLSFSYVTLVKLNLSHPSNSSGIFHTRYVGVMCCIHTSSPKDYHLRGMLECVYIMGLQSLTWAFDWFSSLTTTICYNQLDHYNWFLIVWLSLCLKSLSTCF